MREDFGAISSLLLLFNTNHINKHVTFEEEGRSHEEEEEEEEGEAICFIQFEEDEE